jgi:hypothetical protein
MELHFIPRISSGLCLGLLAACCLTPGIMQAHDLEVCKLAKTAGTLSGIPFNFTVTNSANAVIETFTLYADGPCVRFANLGVGDFVVTEGSTPHTILTAISADAIQDFGDHHIIPGGLVSFDLNAHTAKVHIFDGATTHLKFTNAPFVGNQGCTPGYFKQRQHFDSWTGYTTSEPVSLVFTGVLPSLAAESLLDALQGGGGPGLAGAETILLRAAVAALLNAGNTNVSYPLTTADIISEVNAALATGDRDTILTLATRLDNFNNGPGGCPLN